MNRTITIFIAVLPSDYTSADVEVCETREEAQNYIDEHAPRGDATYCSILERQVVAE